jgi:hypothetical protein
MSKLVYVALVIAVAALAVSLYHWHNGGGKVHLGIKS